MKRKITSLLLFICFTALIAQSSAPQKAQQTIKSKFPNAGNVEWKQSADKYVANFKKGGNQVTAFFDNNGKLIETHTPMAADKMPAPVKNTVGAEFKGFNTKDHAIIETADKETFYKVIVEQGKELVELRVNKEGYILNTVRTPKQ